MNDSNSPYVQELMESTVTFDNQQWRPTLKQCVEAKKYSMPLDDVTGMTRFQLCEALTFTFCKHLRRLTGSPVPLVKNPDFVFHTGPQKEELLMDLRDSVDCLKAKEQPRPITWSHALDIGISFEELRGAPRKEVKQLMETSMTEIRLAQATILTGATPLLPGKRDPSFVASQAIKKMMNNAYKGWLVEFSQKKNRRSGVLEETLVFPSYKEEVESHAPAITLKTDKPFEGVVWGSAIRALKKPEEVTE